MTEIEQARTKDRDFLLSNIAALLQSDLRILAGWIEGSLSHGTADAWSDIDLWTIVRDEDFASVAANREKLAERMGAKVLAVEAPQNGPSRGFYLMVGFECQSGLQLLDWYCQPASSACRPMSNAILFIRRELDESEPWKSSIPEEGIDAIFRRSRRGDDTLRGDLPYAAWKPTHEEELSNSAKLAWAMIAIQAKDIVRNPTAQALQYEPFIGNLVKKATSGKQVLRPSYIDTYSAKEKLDRLVDITGGLVRAVPADVNLKDSILRTLNAIRQVLPED